MIPKKRLQVFVSSTYLDLKEERQSAVEAILRSGHIPAGMELFSAGDATQWEVIKKWIDESDVYMLILGGRYGTIDETSGKSYTQLEYEYAIEKGKPFFAVVISEQRLEEKVKLAGTSVIEKREPQKLESFRELVCSKIVEFWNDNKDIKISIHNKLSEYTNREDLIGWVQGNQAVNGGAIAEEIARLVKENEMLRQQAAMNSNVTATDNLSFAELYQIMSNERLSQDLIYYPALLKLSKVLAPLGKPTLLHLVWYFRKQINQLKIDDNEYVSELMDLNLCHYNGIYQLTQLGKSFIRRLQISQRNEYIDKFIYPYDPDKSV